MKSYVPKDAQRLLRGSIALFKEDKAAFKPFGSAMLIRNPLMPSQGSDINNQISPELATMLLKLNDDEPYSIYKNQKPLTLLVKQFTGATNTTGRDAEDKKLAGALADGKHFRGDSACYRKQAEMQILSPSNCANLDTMLMSFTADSPAWSS